MAFMNLLLTTTLAASIALAPTLGRAAEPHLLQWHTTWTAPAQPVWADDFVLPLGMPNPMENATLRQWLRASVGGQRFRVVVSNEYGRTPLRIGRAAVSAEDGAATPLRFGGAAGAVVAPGGVLASDPVDRPIASGTRLQVDLFLPGRTSPAGFHWDAREHVLLAPGDTVGRPMEATAPPMTARAFITELQVEARREPAAIVALGDSLTDGNGATPGADQRWPDHLSRRLAPLGVAVLNAGISGNRLLRDGMGEGALARLDRDVLRPGVRTVVVLLGTNDIGWPGGPFAPGEALPTLRALQDGFHALVRRAHAKGVRVVAATLPPFEDALRGTPLEGHFSPAKEALRQQLNAWIRASGSFDAVVDFDAILRNPERPSRLLPAFDSGDHLHPGDAGYRAMAEGIPLDILLTPASTEVAR